MAVNDPIQLRHQDWAVHERFLSNNQKGRDHLPLPSQ